MGNSKIVYYGETLIDLTSDTVEAAKLLKGVTAHDKSGTLITGTLADVTQATPAITVDAAGKITASATQAAGVVAAGTKSATKQLTVQAAKTVTPAASAQTAVAKGVFTTGIVTVAAVYAVIGVTYPAGSTCTCSNGSKTLTAKDTTGEAMFIIPSAGTWTVTAADGGRTASSVVGITAEGQVVTVALMFGPLYDEGEFDSSYIRTELKSNATITYEADAIRIVSSGSRICYGFIVFKNVPLTAFNTISVQLTATSSDSDGTTIAVVDDSSNWDPASTSDGTLAYTFDSNKTTKRKTVSLDVSALNGTYDIAIGFSTQGSSWGNARNFAYSTITLT